ncbi:hypothetical protein HQ544_02500 [Candidatus Falkowbacteria bacterium]|nr:hypothetical protein [Candidatus Falkowbacteria bacterium]
MDVSIFLAKVLGLYLVIVSIAILANRKILPKVAKMYMHHEPILFTEGAFALIIGLLMVVSHNIWTSDWRVIITILAWLTLLKGVGRLLAPESLAKWAAKNYKYFTPAGFIIGIVLGVYLLKIGFTS